MKTIKDKYGNVIELEKIGIDYSRVGYDENDDFDEDLVNGEIESNDDYIKELFFKGARFVGTYKYSSYRGGETREFDLRYTTEKLIEIMKMEGPRGTLPKISGGKLLLPMEDLGGGIITSMELEYKGEL